MSWKGFPAAELDGKSWPLDVAATLLEIPERDLRDLVRILGLVPEGTANMRDSRTQGRTSRMYPAGALILICEGIAALREQVVTVILRSGVFSGKA